MMGKTHDHMVKLMLVGDSNVGKSTLMRQFTRKPTPQKNTSTVGLDFGERFIMVGGQKVLVQLWDTAGHQRFRTMTPAYYRSAMGVLLVYSVTDKNSFNSVELWVRQIRQFAHEGTPILLLSNKVDVEEKQVSEQQSRALSERHGLDLIMVSAKDNINIDSAIVRMVHKVDREGGRTSVMGGVVLKGEKPSQSLCAC